MLWGGAEAPLAPLCYGAFALIRAMSSGHGRRSAATRDVGGVARTDCPARRAVEYELGGRSGLTCVPAFA